MYAFTPRPLLLPAPLLAHNLPRLPALAGR